MNCVKMKLVKGMAVGFLAGWLLAGCSSGYSLAGVEGGRIAITDKYDRNTDPEALSILKPYQQKVEAGNRPFGESLECLSSGVALVKLDCGCASSVGCTGDWQAG